MHKALWQQGKHAVAITEAELAKDEIEQGVDPQNELEALERALASYRGEFRANP